LPDETPRSRAARIAAERALVRVVHHYGSQPEFVVLGGLVPELLCASSDVSHSGTTDIDVQVNLEIQCGSVNMPRLEQALRNAEFHPERGKLWRWSADGRDDAPQAVIKFELLADLDDMPANQTVSFDDCEQLGAANLRGTRYAVRDVAVRELVAKVGGEELSVSVNVTGLAGFLLAKAAAAYSRRAPKDWYDIAFVLRHNDEGGPTQAADVVRERFPDDLVASQPMLRDLWANFSDVSAQGPEAYASQMELDDPESDRSTAAADAVVVVDTFYRSLYEAE